jgi:hypothetical protein
VRGLHARHWGIVELVQMDNNRRHEDTYEFRRWTPPVEYLLALVNTAIAVNLIVFGPLWAKILFAYYLLAALLTLRRRYASLGSDHLLVRFPTAMRIPYSHIDAVTALPLKGLRRMVARIATGTRKHPVDAEVILNRRHWVVLFPLPIVVPTKRLRLPLRDSPSFVQSLTRHPIGTERRDRDQTPSA